MDLDFSLLTFSPSHAKKNLKLSSASKRSSKLKLRHKQLYSVKTKGTVPCQEKCTSTNNLKSVQETLPKIDFAVGDNVKQFFGAVHDKPVIKSRVGKGKENRGIDSCTVDSTCDSGWLGTTTAKNDHKRCRKLSSDHCLENGSSRKKRSIEVVMNSSNQNTIDDLMSKMNTCISTCGKSSGSSCGSSRYFSCSQNAPECSVVLIPESSCSSVDQRSYEKGKNNGVNGSIIVISDSSSTSSVISNSICKRQMKHSLTSVTKEQRSDVQKVKCKVVGDTSDGENDVLGANNEAPCSSNSIVRSPLDSDSKLETCSNTRHEGGHVTDVEFTLPATPSQLNQAKYQDIKNWLSNVKSLDKSDCDDADETLEGNSVRKTEETERSTDTNVDLNSSAEEILDSLYGTAWRKQNANSKRHNTVPCKKKCSRNVPVARQYTECKKQKVAKSGQSVVSSTDSEEFDNFLKNVRQKFESTRRNSVLATPDFIDDDDYDNSLTFYQNVCNSKDVKQDALCLNWKPDRSTPLYSVGACKQLSFSNSGDDGDDEPAKEHGCIKNHDKPKTKNSDKKLEDLKKKKNVKRPQKILVSPVKQTLVKRTPKTVGQTKLKSCVNKQVGNKFCSPVLSFLGSLSAGTPSGRCHPEAQYYKDKFGKKKEELCRKLFTMYNDKIFDNKLPQDMLVEWNVRLKRTAGFCYNRRTVIAPGTKIRTSRIELSTKVCDTADRLRDTLVHELCHAATWVVDDIKDGHGPHWKAWARKARHVFPELPPIKRCHDYNIQTKFTYRCTGCGYSIGRHSKSLNVATKRCGHCYGIFELLINTRRKSGTIAQEALKKRSPAGFARFVKENYSSVKQSRTDLKHGDVMRLLGQQFSAVKIGPDVRKPH